MTNITARKNMIPLKELNLTSRFLFAAVMEDTGTQQDVLSIILGRDIPLLERSESEKELRVSPLIRSVRMDIFSMDEEQTVYATEMQDWKKSDLAKRSRYYQSMLDTSLLEPGVPDYNLLNQTYLIMIMTFDLFGEEKYQYTFRQRCDEVPECVLPDGAVRIFLNTKGRNDTEISEELKVFLNYVENTTDETVKKSDSERMQRIHERVCSIKSNEEMGVKYMHAWEEQYYLRQEGIEQGIEQGRRDHLTEQIVKKLNRGKSAAQIADELEEDVEIVNAIIKEVSSV